MMKLALLLVLLPLSQEDPQVTYREGLFEEVDQGNLDKAAELYAKVLKSGASDGLKAKALLRTGFCQEKKGKKKEAEQSWRDVIERFPGATETIKLARERLSSISWDGGSLSTPLESKIQSLVLELTGEFDQQNAAVRKLVAIGQPAVPELRKAMLSQAHDLRGAAAYVLVQIGAFEGVYEGVKPLWIEDGQIGPWPSYALGETLKAREEDRKQFLKDIKPAVFPTLFGRLFRHLGSSPDPAIAKMVEDHLVEGGFAWDVYFQPWTENRELSEIRRMTKRLAGAKQQPNAKVREMLKSRATPRPGKTSTPSDPELKQALLTAFTGDSDPSQLLRSISVESQGQFFQTWWIFEYLTPREFVRGPIATWILRGPEEVRSKILYMIQSTVGHNPTAGTDFAKEIRQFQLEFINTPEHPLELRRRVFVSATFPDTPELQKKFLQFCLQSLKEEGGDPEEEDQRKSAAAYWLMQRLEPDSKEMKESLELAARGGWLATDLMSERTGLRAPAIATAIQALKDPKLPEKSVVRLLNVLENLATPQEKAMLGPVVGLMESEPESAIRIFHSGIIELPEEDRQAAWKTYLEAFDASPDSIKATMAEVLVGSEGAHVAEVMAQASASSNASARHAALRHWSEAAQIPLKSRTPLLAKGLKDAVENNQLQAIKGLTLHPDLDAVPEIIECLNSPFAEVRAAARTALEEIKKHYEAQAEWKRWYDETRKALKK